MGDQAKKSKKIASNGKPRKHTFHSVDYTHHPHHHKTYESCAANIRINERIRKQRIEFSNDLHDVVVCMPSALDALKFEVLVGSKIDPKTTSTNKMLSETQKMMTADEADRVEALMSDE